MDAQHLCLHTPNVQHLGHSNDPRIRTTNRADFDQLDQRADNSDTIDDAVAWDDDDEADDDLDVQPGEWRDGSFYASMS